MDQQLIVRRLQVSDEHSFLTATATWDFAEGFHWDTPKAGQSFSDFVTLLEQNEQGMNLPSGYVPATVLYAFLGNNLVARASIRHELNDFLRKIAGHIAMIVDVDGLIVEHGVSKFE